MGRLLLLALLSLPVSAAAQMPMQWEKTAETPLSTANMPNIALVSITAPSNVQYQNIGSQLVIFYITQLVSGDPNPTVGGSPAPPPIWADWLRDLTVAAAPPAQTGQVKITTSIHGSEGGAYLLQGGNTYRMYVTKWRQTGSQTFTHPFLGTVKRDRVWDTVIAYSHTDRAE